MSIFDEPEFLALDDEKKDFMKSVLEKSNGKQPMEVLNIMAQESQRRGKSISLSNEERNILIKVITKNMNANELNRFNQIMSMINR